MPILGDASLEPLESLASSGKKYSDATADSNSNALQPLTGSAGQDQHHPGGAMTLPMLDTTFTMTEGGSGVHEVLLPRLVGDGWTGGQGAVGLPALTGTGAGTVPGQALSNTTLPLLIGDGSGGAGWGGGAYPGYSTVVLPALSGTGWFAGRGAVALPALAGAGAGSFVGSGMGAAVLPALRGAGTSAVFSYPGYSFTVLPALRAGTYGIGVLVLPLLRGAGYDAGSVAGSGIGVGAFEGWALNLRTGFVGRITNWPFRQIVKWGDKTLGVGADGLYLLGGVTDVGQVMQWEWRTGLDDLGQPGVKRVPYVYLDAVIDGEIEITTIDDHGDMRAYHYEADRGRINLPHRRELGKGVRTRNIAIGARNGTNGAFMEMYSLEPEATVTQRSI